ncbi:nitroreductase [Nocardia panacis]|uniref:Nitroreductase n=1 Tax=Nocardia panacis TaxID=2340916 RepID=A0A3A4KG12_9NOCA|nr:nitroreductase [Nocardia panacis]RJO73379.1 nitroreductase [Nocardia panacis]
MDVYTAVAGRRAVRAFDPRPIPHDTLERVMTAATRAPSGANLQPWRVYVVTGAALTQLKHRTGARVASGDSGDEPEYRMYPPRLPEPYGQRRAAAAEQRYGALGIARTDDAGRAAQVARNWDCFGAPAALFCYIDAVMGPPQWADTGMFLQTVMLLLRAEGLDSCLQMAWSIYHRSVAETVGPPEGSTLFCGMSIGYADPDAREPRIDRAPVGETISFITEQMSAAVGG